MFESLKVILINMVAILMVSAKLASLGLLKIKVFWNRGYVVMISVHSVTNKILLRDSNYIVDEFMWPKFDNSCISMHFLNFLRNALGSSSIIGTGTRYGLKFYTSVDKGLELKVKRFWELIPTFLEVVGEKLIKKTQGSLLWIWLK